MMTALTTANFPDVMLPAYYENFYVMFFFIIYLMVGIYFLLSILIANVFNKYKNRLEDRIKKHANKRRDQIAKAYCLFDQENRGYLTNDEFKAFFGFVFDLDMSERISRHHYRKVLQRLQISDKDPVDKELIVDFVHERGAIELRRAADQMKQLN